MNKSQKKAVWIAEKVIKGLVVTPGLKEMDVARAIRVKLKQYGTRPAFRTIVASGRRAALPHGFATNKIIRRGELVVIDFGALYNGYCSDITRTVVVGKPTARQKRIYRVVKRAKLRAIRKVKVGVACCEVDRAPRGFIAGRGFGEYFIHTTGHGIGRKIHEAPKISKGNKHKLKAGMVITIEPGIYIKGWGGVRLEDMVVVTSRGCEILTRAPGFLK